MNKDITPRRKKAVAAYYADPERNARVGTATAELAVYLGRLMRPNEDWAGLSADDLINVAAEALRRTLSHTPAGQAAAIALAQEFFERTNRTL